MIVLKRGKLNPDFLIGSATTNCRAAMKQLFPAQTIKGRALQELLKSVDLDEMSISPQQFKNSMWELVDGTLTGSFHIMKLSDYELQQRDVSEILRSLYERVKLLCMSDTTISTNQPIDARFVKSPENEELLEILYLGEAQAETADHTEDREEIIEDRHYKLKAYLMIQIPVISKITIGSKFSGVSVVTRPVHRGVTPKAELSALQFWLSERLQFPIPPHGGLKKAIKKLMLEKRLEPIQLDSEESDGTRVKYARAKGSQNRSSKEAEDIFKSWETHAGSLCLDDTCNFKIDTARAVFSFNGRTTLTDANHVIQTVLGAIN